MQNKWKVVLPVAIAALLLLIVVIALAQRLPQQPASEPILVDSSSIHVNPVNALRSDFIMGADVSMLSQIEASGGKYFVNGIEEDPLKILKDHGVNWIRLRIWNDPTDASGGPLGGGNDDLRRTVEIAARARKMGLKFLLDFHYSDWWADPGKQNMPKAWVGMDQAKLDQAVYDYTAKVIMALRKAGAMPDMVQVGNEVSNGLLWPLGATNKQGDAQIGGYDSFADLLKHGVQAVRDNDPNNADLEKRTRIMIHLADGGNHALYQTVFDELTARDVDFDVIGLSYYSFWHGPMNFFRSNMNDISDRYHKDVVVAETSYANTLEDGDGLKNLFGANEQNNGGYKASVQGQATAIRDVISAVAKVPNGKGLGVFYWEPDWIPAAGAGWKTGEGDAWDNQALFDFKGNALPSLNVFNMVRPDYGAGTVEARITALDPVAIKLPAGEPLRLPVTIPAFYSDDSIQKVVVIWDPVDPAKLNAAGSFIVNGGAANTDLKAVAVVTIGGDKNFVLNPGFESGDLTSWTVDGDASAVDISGEAQNILHGERALHYWAEGPYSFTLSQNITGLEDGTYTLSASIQGGGGEKLVQLYAIDSSGATLTVDILNTGWQVWTEPTIVNIAVANSEVTVGLKVQAPGGNWAFVDDVTLVRNK